MQNNHHAVNSLHCFFCRKLIGREKNKTFIKNKISDYNNKKTTYHLDQGCPTRGPLSYFEAQRSKNRGRYLINGRTLRNKAKDILYCQISSRKADFCKIFSRNCRVGPFHFNLRAQIFLYILHLQAHKSIIVDKIL